jgi:hypothetical protein
MGGCMSGEAGRHRSRTESSNSSMMESPRRSYEVIRNQANSSREGSPSRSSSDTSRQFEESLIEIQQDKSEEEWKAIYENYIIEELEEQKNKAIRNGLNKINKYEQNAMRWQEEDRNTFKDFQEAFKTDIKEINGIFIVKSDALEGGGTYKNGINIDNGQIIGIKNFKWNTNSWYSSEIVYNQLRLVLDHARKDISQFDITNWKGSEIANIHTKYTLNLFVPEETNFMTFKAGEDGFIALAGTQTAQSKFYLLAQHPKAFKGKQVRSITVRRLSDGEINIDYEIA